MKKIAVLGCTGSIGTQTLDIISKNRDKYKVVGLSCGSDAAGLAKLAAEFDCDVLGIADESKRDEVKRSRGSATVYCGDDALTHVLDAADTAVIAVVGMIGLKAVLYAIDRGITVALANKESLVAGGEIVMSRLKRGGALLCPIDSEHSAVWQCLRGEADFKRIILTASGGPFFCTPIDRLKRVTPEQAVAHPNWRMGKKISVDSATMVNKALELIEARWLFDTKNVDYVIHPESIVHSMVEFADGSIKAQAGFPDMRQPIQYALTYPEHAPREYTPLDLPLSLRFYPPDEQKFRAPRLAKHVIATGGLAGTVFNAANEAAVRLFCERRIAFTDITDIVENALENEDISGKCTVDGVFATHNRVYDKIYLKYQGE